MVCPESQRLKLGFNGVVSLLDMLRLYADLFVRAICGVHTMESWKPTDEVIKFPFLIAAGISSLQLDCEQHGLTNTAQKSMRIMYKCNTVQLLTYRDIVTDLKDLHERLEDELQSRVFLSLSSSEGQLFDKPDAEWQDVIRRFPRMRHDVEEASKCFAFARYAAALFHVLLVAEFGVIEVAKLFKVEGDKPGWGALQRLQRIKEKKWEDQTPLERQHSEFLNNLLPFALAIRDSWRHKISHVDNKLEWMDTDFSPEVAGEIISATRGFMRRLASDLPK